MSDQSPVNPHLILPIGTQVVALVEVKGTDGKPVHPRGAVGVIIHSPKDYWHSYRVRFPDGFEAPFKRPELSILSQYKQQAVRGTHHPLAEHDLYPRAQAVSHPCPRCWWQAHTQGGDDVRNGLSLRQAQDAWQTAVRKG